MKFLFLTISIYLIGCSTKRIKGDDRTPSRLPPENQKADVNQPNNEIDKIDGVDDLIKKLKLIEVETYTWSGASVTPSYQEIMEVTKPENRYEKSDNIPTNAHETVHGLSREMKYNQSRSLDYFYYVGNQKGVYIREPDMHFKHAAEFVPVSQRKIHQGRYDLYMVKQGQWEPALFMSFDEWSAYVYGTKVAIEMANKGTWPEDRVEDKLDGMLNFLVYTSAVLMALDQHEPDYLKETPEVITLFKINVIKSMALLEQGLQYEFFSKFKDKEITDLLRTAQDAEGMRNVLRAYLGKDFTKKYLGF